MKLFVAGALDPVFGRVAALILPLLIAGCATAPVEPIPPEASHLTVASPSDRQPADAQAQIPASTTTADTSDHSEPIEIFSPAAPAVESASNAGPDSDRDPATAPEQAAATPPAEAPARKLSIGTHGRADNWFLRDLPVLRIKFPDDGSAVEGVHYKKIVLRRCPKVADANLETEPTPAAEPGPASAPAEPAKVDAAEPITTAYYPGRNLEAIEVQLHGKTLGCTTGAVDINPEVALSLLLKSSPTALMYPGAPGHVTAFSRTGFNQSVESSFEVPVDTPEGEGDEIFVPTSIDSSDRVYVAAKGAGGSWRLILPVAGDLPLKALSEKLALIPEQADSTVLDLLASSASEDSSEPRAVMAKTWSMLERTSDDLDLRDSFYSTYRIPLRLGDEHTTDELAKLTKKFSYRFASSDAATTEIFHAVGEREEFVLSRSVPMWRAVANLIHQTAHAVQNPGAVDSADLTFRNEMDAQLKQEAYLKHIAGRSEGLRLMIENYNSIAAVAARRVRWAETEAPAAATSLCENVIDSYSIDRTLISAATLQEYSCPVAANSPTH